MLRRLLRLPFPFLRAARPPLAIAALVGVGLHAMPGPAAGLPTDTTDNGGPTAGSVEVVARFDVPDPSGIAVTSDGRIFVGFPRHADDHSGPTLGELKAGKIVPYPDARMSLPSDLPAPSFS